jgi:hypothetical protein
MRRSVAIGFISACLFITTNSIGETKSDTGQFQYQFSTVDVTPSPGSKPNSMIQATVGFEIRNTGSNPVRVAMIPDWPTLQTEGGAHFTLRRGGVSGLPMISSGRERACDDAAQRLSIIRSGRISGQLYVKSAETGKCWIEPFTAANVSVAVHP